MASLAKWLSVRLRTKWLWVRIPLQSLALLVSLMMQEKSLYPFPPKANCQSFNLGFSHFLIREHILRIINRAHLSSLTVVNVEGVT